MSDFAPRSRELGSLLLGGGVLLVIGATVLSLMANGFTEPEASYRKNQELGDLIAMGQSQLSETQVAIRLGQEKLARWEKQVAADREYQRLSKTLAQASTRTNDLITAASKLELRIVDLEKERVSYQARMRRLLWPRFRNLKLKKEHLSKPLEFETAVITRVDAAGIMIRHQSGVSRIPVADLAPRFREELDLNLEEADKAMSKIHSLDAQFKRRQKVNEDMIDDALEINQSEAQDRTLTERKNRVEQLSQLIASADAEAANAKAQDRTSRNRSAPGSLETWAKRANRFAQAALNYRNQRAAAVLAVKELDPDYSWPDK